MQTRIVNIEEAAKAMGVSRQTFYTRVRNGRVPDRVCDNPQRWIEGDIRMYNDGGYQFAHDQWTRKVEFISKVSEWLEFIVDTKMKKDLPTNDGKDAARKAWVEAAEAVAPEVVALAIAAKAALENSFIPVPTRHELAKQVVNFNFDRSLADMSPNELKTIRSTTDAFKKLT